MKTKNQLMMMRHGIESMATHPREISIGDISGIWHDGRDRDVVVGIEFIPGTKDIPDFHMEGAFSFRTDKGFFNVAFDGRNVPVWPFVFLK